MKEKLQFLIDKYTHEIEELQEDIRSEFCGFFKKGKLEGLKEFVEDLKELLKEAEE